MFGDKTSALLLCVKLIQGAFKNRGQSINFRSSFEDIDKFLFITTEKPWTIVLGYIIVFIEFVVFFNIWLVKLTQFNFFYLIYCHFTAIAPYHMGWIFFWFLYKIDNAWERNLHFCWMSIIKGAPHILSISPSAIGECTFSKSYNSFTHNFSYQHLYIFTNRFTPPPNFLGFRWIPII